MKMEMFLMALQPPPLTVFIKPQQCFDQEIFLFSFIPPNGKSEGKENLTLTVNFKCE